MKTVHPVFNFCENHVGFRRSATLRGEKPQTLIFYAFDLVYLNGFDLRRAALIDRRRLLSSIILPGEIIRYSEHFAGKGQELLDAARARGWKALSPSRRRAGMSPNAALTGARSKSPASRTSSSADTFLVNVNHLDRSFWVITKAKKLYMPGNVDRALPRDVEFNVRKDSTADHENTCPERCSVARSVLLPGTKPELIMRSEIK